MICKPGQLNGGWTKSAHSRALEVDSRIVRYVLPTEVSLSGYQVDRVVGFIFFIGDVSAMLLQSRGSDLPLANHGLLDICRFPDSPDPFKLRLSANFTGLDSP
jgi:hypothetical protein